MLTCVLPFNGFAYDLPTSICDTIGKAVVTAEKGFIASRCDTISTISCVGVEDALLKIPGLSLNDNGGFSGLKTISLRGMGSSQTGIYIDGVKVSNNSSGQTDIGMLGVWHFDKIIIDYAQNKVDFRTAKPQFKDTASGERSISGKISSLGGSFGTYIPSISLSFKGLQHITASINSDFITSRSHREHSDIKQNRTSIDLFGKTIDGKWTAKAYANYSNRLSPGSTNYIYLSNQEDINSFIQGVINRRFGERYTLNASSKISYDQMTYADSWAESTYKQTEAQINSSHIIDINEWLHLSFAQNLNIAILKSNQYTQSISSKTSNISRFEGTISGGASCRTNAVRAEIGMEYNGAYDHCKKLLIPSNYRQSISPSANVRIDIGKGFLVSAFGRKAYRIPTFNELYYIGFGNTGLQPENAWLTDIGLEWKSNFWKHISILAKTNLFFNWLTDKIAAAPSQQDPNIWLPYNIDKVRSTGGDISISTRFNKNNWSGALTARYSLQDARNRTHGSEAFNSQIPHIAKHSIIVDANIAFNEWHFTTIWNLREGISDTSGWMLGWNTLDASFSKRLHIKDLCDITISITTKNMTDYRYEISRGYPMPGWALYGGLCITF